LTAQGLAKAQEAQDLLVETVLRDRRISVPVIDRLNEALS
jgi:hypothetical protein